VNFERESGLPYGCDCRPRQRIAIGGECVAACAAHLPWESALRESDTSGHEGHQRDEGDGDDEHTDEGAADDLKRRDRNAVLLPGVLLADRKEAEEEGGRDLRDARLRLARRGLAGSMMLFTSYTSMLLLQL
jgi:hypothetical protein